MMENSNTNPQQAIPDEIKRWYIAESHKPLTHATFKEWERRGQQLCYEVAYTDGYQEASEAMYRRLSSSVGLRWVKANERLPETEKSIFFEITFPGGRVTKFAGFLMILGDGNTFVAQAISYSMSEYGDRIRWLEEPESPLPIEQEGWTKVSDKMPEGDVLLLTTSRMIYIGDWYVDGWRTHLSKWQPIYGATHEKLVHAFKLEDVTHWRPLPSPPTIK